MCGSGSTFRKTKWCRSAFISAGIRSDFNRKRCSYVEQELRDWANLGVEGHFRGKNSWFTYHRLLTEQTAQLVGGGFV